MDSLGEQTGNFNSAIWYIASFLLLSIITFGTLVNLLPRRGHGLQPGRA